MKTLPYLLQVSLIAIAGVNHAIAQQTLDEPAVEIRKAVKPTRTPLSLDEPVWDLPASEDDSRKPNVVLPASLFGAPESDSVIPAGAVIPSDDSQQPADVPKPVHLAEPLHPIPAGNGEIGEYEVEPIPSYNVPRARRGLLFGWLLPCRGEAGFFHEPPFGSAVRSVLEQQVQRGIQTQRALYQYDFDRGNRAGQLSWRGRHQLQKFASSIVCGMPIVIEPSPGRPDLDEVRRQHVIAQLGQMVDIENPDELVVVGRPEAIGLSGRSAQIINRIQQMRLEFPPRSRNGSGQSSGGFGGLLP